MCHCVGSPGVQSGGEVPDGAGHQVGGRGGGGGALRHHPRHPGQVSGRGRVRWRPPGEIVRVAQEEGKYTMLLFTIFK